MRIYFRETRTTKGNDLNVKDMLSAVGSIFKIGQCSCTAAATEAIMEESINPGKQIGFYSERCDSAVTVTALSVTYRGYIVSGAPNARFRFKVYRIVSGGTGLETLVASLDSAQTMTATETVYTDSLTMTNGSFVLSAGERLVLRITAIPVSGQSFGTGIVGMKYNGSSAGGTDSGLNVTPDPTFRANYATLYLRNTTTIGISGMTDMLETGGATASTATVSTTAVDTQWTATAGGAALTWVGPRFADGWYLDNPVNPDATKVSGITFTAYFSESALQANAAIRGRLYRLRNGVETLVAIMDNGTEFATSQSPRTLSSADAGNTFTPTPWLEDDRPVLRLHVINATATTLGTGRTCAFDYNTNNTSGAGILKFLESAKFKAESDPAASPTVEGGMQMRGMSN